MRAHVISCFSFLELSKWRGQVSVFLSYQNGGVRSKTWMFGYLGYRGYFFSDFVNPIFRFSPIVRHENLDYKNPKFSNIISIFTYSQMQKLEFQKSKILIQTSVFRYLPIVKYKNLDFKNPRFSNIRLNFRYSHIVKYENLDHKSPRFLNVQRNIQLF